MEPKSMQLNSKIVIINMCVINVKALENKLSVRPQV